jgi:putative ABC transport system permease protein
VTPTTLGPGLGATYQRVQAVGLDGTGADRVLDLDVRAGSLDALGDDGVALSERRARLAHTRVGRRVPIMLGDGHRRDVRVAAIYARSLGFGEVVLPRAVLAGHLTDPQPRSVLVSLAPGASAAAVTDRLRRLSSRYPGLTVGGRRTIAARADESRAANDWLFAVLAAIVFAFTAVAVVNTMAMIAVHRTRELGLLRLIGATPRQVRVMALCEAAFVGAIGVGLGAAIALVALAPTSTMLGGSLLPFAPAGLVVAVLGSAAVVSVAGGQIATRLVLRGRPADAIAAVG